MTMPKRRTANFREDETRLLIQLWGSPTIQNQMITSHRKAPIMLQLAALMQQYGFYRTPEEITTRIRNLKCIYHRIKKSLRTGIGLVDPDWHHFKAIDAILGNGSSHYGPGSDFSRRVIKTENTLDDVTNSIYSNDSQSSFYDDDREITGSYTSSPPMQGLTITSSTAAMADLSSSLRLNQAAAASRTRYNFGSEISIRPIVEIKKEPGQPFPLSASRVGAANHSGSSDDFNFKSPEPKRRCMPTQNDNEVSGLLRQLLDVEREHLELEKQRLEFDRMVGTQLLALVPMVGSIIQNHYLSQQQQQQQQKHQNSPSQSNFQAESPSQMEPTTVADDDEDQDEDDEDEEENEVNTQDIAEDVGNSILKSFAEFQSIQLKNKANEVFPVTSSLPSKDVNSDREQSLKSNKSPARESLSSDDLSEDTEASCDGSEANALSGTANAEKTECLEKLKDADIENGERNFPEIIESEDDITFLENC